MKKSFTLIESIVVVGVIALAIPVLFAILFAILREQVKIYRLTEVKRNGDYFVNLMENTIRNYAYTIIYDDGNPLNFVTVCPPTGTPYNNISIANGPGQSTYFFVDKYSNRFQYYWNGTATLGSAGQYYATPTPPGPTPVVTLPILASQQVNSSKVNILSYSMFCSRASQYSAPIISVSFTVCYKVDQAGSCLSTRPEETASLTYQTYIKLRNFPTQ